MKKKDQWITAIGYIAIGVMCLVFRAALLNWLMTVAGIVLIVLGVMNILKKDYPQAVGQLVVGLLIILGGWLFVELMLIVLGVLVLVSGLQTLFTSKRKLTPKEWATTIVTIVFGAFLIVSKWVMLDWIFIIIGVLIIAEGVLRLVEKKK